MKSETLLIIQEILPKYRLDVFNEIAQVSDGKVTVFSDASTSDFGDVNVDTTSFEFVKAKWHKYFGIFKHDWQSLKLWRSHDVTLHVADFKFLSLWILLLLTYFSSKKIYLHGQGGYKKKGQFVKLIYSTVMLLSDGYICYTEYSKEALKMKVPRFLHKKISVCDNTLKIKPVDHVLTINQSNSIFYIGRLRPGCEIENLLNASKNSSLHVEVIGSGDIQYLEILQHEFKTTATFHGAVFDEQKQREIASSCIAGAYGGDAGLSVVHYMALGLPVIVHGEIDKHMGPEPSYVVDGVNGLIFERNNIDSLSEKISLLVKNNELRYSLAQGALHTFKSMQCPTMAIKFVKIMGLEK
jgi:glycosyltransferase involved in cell wall biosynthesis